MTVAKVQGRVKHRRLPHCRKSFNSDMSVPGAVHPFSPTITTTSKNVELSRLRRSQRGNS